MLNNNDYLNIFHEIKNSITLIGSSLQLVAKKHPEVTVFDYWDETMSEISFLREMVTELSCARPANHENFKPMDLHTLMEHIAYSTSAIISEDFHCDVHFSEITQPVEMDAMLMKQAIINLLKNGYEAMHNTGLIRINISTENDHARIDIIDQGGGLDPAFADKIFDSFVTSKNGGSGLGLAITKQIVESHQGTLTCESRPGDGCTFTIMLPFSQS